MKFTCIASIIFIIFSIPLISEEKLSPVGIWIGKPFMYSSKNKHKQMKLIFKKNGVLVFKNEFEFFNPGKWEYDRNEKILSIFIPFWPKKFSCVLEECKLNGHIVKYDKSKKMISYKLNKDSNGICLLRLIYYRQQYIQSLKAEKNK